MNKYIAIVATKNKTIENWDGTSEFTDEALTQLAETAQNKPILIDFDENRQIGRILSAKNDDGKLTLVVTIDNKIPIGKEQRIVPGFIVHQDGWDTNENKSHRIIRDVESCSYGLTYKPAEKGLPEIEKQ